MEIESQKTIKKTYSLPKFLVQKFENIAQKRERSGVISMLIERKSKESGLAI